MMVCLFALKFWKSYMWCLNVHTLFIYIYIYIYIYICIKISPSTRVVTISHALITPNIHISQMWINYEATWRSLSIRRPLKVKYIIPSCILKSINNFVKSNNKVMSHQNLKVSAYFPLLITKMTKQKSRSMHG